MLLLTSVVGYSMFTRTPLGLDVIRDRNSLYRETDDGLIENVYQLKVLNKDAIFHSYDLSLESDIPLQLRMDTDRIEVESGGVGEYYVRVQADPDVLTQQSTEFSFRLVSNDRPELEVSEPARMVGPDPGK